MDPPEVDEAVRRLRLLHPVIEPEFFERFFVMLQDAENVCLLGDVWFFRMLVLSLQGKGSAAPNAKARYLWPSDKVRRSATLRHGIALSRSEQRNLGIRWNQRFTPDAIRFVVEMMSIGRECGALTMTEEDMSGLFARL